MKKELKRLAAESFWISRRHNNCPIYFAAFLAYKNAAMISEIYT